MPPVAVTVPLYDAPTVPDGSDVVVMASVPDCPAPIARFRFAVAVWKVGLVESVTVMVKFAVPVALWVGVPEIVPVIALIESPVGNPVALKLKGERPPVTVMIAL